MSIHDPLLRRPLWPPLLSKQPSLLETTAVLTRVRDEGRGDGGDAPAPGLLGAHLSMLGQQQHHRLDNMAQGPSSVSPRAPSSSCEANLLLQYRAGTRSLLLQSLELSCAIRWEAKTSTAVLLRAWYPAAHLLLERPGFGRGQVWGVEEDGLSPPTHVTANRDKQRSEIYSNHERTAEAMPACCRRCGFGR